jgi:regulator of cell morphogenesis and NO signaling
MYSDEVLDVTIIEPRLKHPTIFQKFDSLLPGEGFVIHNDHDPKPLYYQLVGERGPVFTWAYLENGPEYWKVEIRKAGKEEEASIGELVKKDFRKAEVFKKFGIDFCCGGKKTISKVCEEKGIDHQELEKALNNLDLQAKGKNLNFDSWSLSFLADYINNTHHNYVKEAIPVILTYAQKVVHRHGESHPEVIGVANHFVAVANELTHHMQKEEMILFPYVKRLEQAFEGESAVPQAAFGSVQNPIKMIESEHESAGSELEEIRKLTNGYSAPADACTTFKVLYQKLEEFENDLFEHIHLENNILFPKAIELEKELSKR